MSDPKPYRATADELRAIDEAYLLDNGGTPISDAELPAMRRQLAAHYRELANQAETVEMRITLLEFAEQLDQQAKRLGG